MSDGIRLIEDLGAEFARVAADVERRAGIRSPARRSRRLGPRLWTLAIATTVALLLGGTAFAVPGTRLAFGSLADAMVGWFSGHQSKTPSRTEDISPPAWLTDRREETRLLATTGDVALHVRKEYVDGRLLVRFSMGRGRGVTATMRGWHREIAHRALYVLGFSIVSRARYLDERGRFPLYALVARGVDRVRLRYLDGGPPLVSDVGDGGVVLMVDAWRVPRDLIAYDKHGRAVGREDVSNVDQRYLCERDVVRVCPPTERIRMSWPFTALATGENWMGPA